MSGFWGVVQLQAEGVPTRVGSMPSWALFESQDKSCQRSGLPLAVRKRVPIEAGSSIGWHKYVTDEGAVVGPDRFGESGPGEAVLTLLGFSVDNVVAQARAVLQGHPEEEAAKEVLS